MTDDTTPVEEDDELTFYDLKQVAEMFQVRQETVRGWIREGDLKAMKVGNRLRFSKKDLKDFARSKYTSNGDS